MPSKSKHLALARHGFTLAKTCGTCLHWIPQSTAPECRWGNCSISPYQHEKHTDPKTAGTPEIGTCNDHALDSRCLPALVGDDYAARYAPKEEQ